MPSSATPAGGTGFLFGNIDQRGRLDAEYLSDDAKDNIENVRPAVQDNNLYHVDGARRAPLPAPAPAPAHDDDDDDDEAYDDPPLPRAPGEPPAQDFADESDDDGLRDADRKHLASRALATAPAGGRREDEEDYDDYDDDERPKAPATASTAAPSSGALASPSAQAGARSAPGAPAPDDPALSHQRKLLADARAAAAAPDGGSSVPGTPERPSSPASPLLFSDMLKFSPPRLRFRRRHRRLGLPAGAPPAPEPAPAPDEAARLLRPPTPPALDPVAAAVAADEPARAQRFPPPSRAAPPPRLRARPDDENYRAAAAPLDPAATEPDVGGAAAQTPHLVRQIAWERDILWRGGKGGAGGGGGGVGGGGGGDDDDDDDDDAEAWEDLAVEAPPEAAAAGGDDDDDDDDAFSEDDFEDAVELNKRAPPKPAEPAPDSDDDIDWEDGDTTAKPEEPNASSSQPSSTQPMSSSQQTGSQPTGSTPKGSQQTELASQNVAKGAGGGKAGVTAGKPSGLAIPKSKPAPRQLPPGCQLVKSLLAPNRELDDGDWVRGIVWDSASDGEGASDATAPADVSDMGHRVGHLILDLNDQNMCFEEEHPSDEDEDDKAAELRKQAANPAPADAALTAEQMKEMITSSGASVHQALQIDRLNISNDLYYASGASNNLNKINHHSIMRGLQNAPPALKVQTTPSAMSDIELLSFHRPKLTKDRAPKSMTLVPVRRKRPRGGTSQIAGQMPKRKSDLLCSEKDAYRVSLFEYAIERQPCLLPVPGMASRLLTYAREESAAAVANANKQAAGTPDADTIFMCPDEPPPLVSGNIEAGDKKLSVIESHLYTAPCVKHDTPTTDFLLVRHGKHMYVREIDSVMSLGITEPKVEVMAPNTERYKKYSRERMVLWVMREFQRMRKEISKAEKKNKDKDDTEIKPVRNPPYIEKDEIFKEFPRRRTYPETGLTRALKEMSRFHNGKYMMAEDVAKNYSQREAELLRILTPTETAAFEAMESGWEQILDRGICNFTHPSGQGNILAAAEADRSGLEAGPAVGKYIKTLLLKTPWYRSNHMLASHNNQKKDLTQALNLARIVNDLREGGTATEERLMTLSPIDMNNVLTQVFRYNSKKIPMDIEVRLNLVRDLSQRKGKGAPSADVTDYPTIIRAVMKKHRDIGLSKGAAIAAMGTSLAGGTFLGIPLDIQRRALEDGDVDDLPAEEDDFEVDEQTQAILAAGDAAFGKKPPPKKKDPPPALGKSKKTFMKPPSASLAGSLTLRLGLTSQPAGPSKDSSSGVTPGKPPPLPSSSSKKPDKEKTPGGGKKDKDGAGASADDAKKVKKKVTRIKVTKKKMVNGELTPVISYVTDPDEITRLLADRKKTQAEKQKPSGSEERPPASSGNLKIAIDLKQLQGGINKKKKNVLPPEKPKKAKKSAAKEDGTTPPSKKPPNAHIGKIKINTKHFQRDKEQAALKRKRSQYGDDIEYRAKKTAKTSRRKRNGRVELNNILEKIEGIIRQTEGYLVPSATVMKVARLKDGESPPPGVTATNLAKPAGTGLDFTVPVDLKSVPQYKEYVKNPMYLNMIKTQCKQGKYNTASEFIEHMQLMADNARAFNRAPEDQWVVQHAQLLFDVAKEQVSRRVEDIKAAEDMLKMEDLEAKASGAGSKSKNKNKGKSKGKSKSKGGDKKKSKSGTVGKDGVITIADDDDDGKGAKKSGKPGRASDVIDLDNEADGESQGARGAPIDKSPAPLGSPGMLDAGMTDAIYGGAPGQGSDQLVLDLDKGDGDAY